MPFLDASVSLCGLRKWISAGEWNFELGLLDGLPELRQFLRPNLSIVGDYTGSVAGARRWLNSIRIGDAPAAYD